MTSPLILDCRVSGANDAAERHERILLPKAWDIIRDIMALRKACREGESVYLFVLDFKDALYMLPLLSDERRYFTAYHQGRWYVWERVAQGSLNGPNAFGRLSALTGRMTQGLMSSTGARVQIYTDDPCTVMKGSESEVKRHIAAMTLFWLVLGWGLSFHKGQWGKQIEWIGFQFLIDEDGVEAKIKGSSMKDFTRDAAYYLHPGRIQLATLRSFTGRTSHIANLLYAWRPFINELWGTVHERKKAGDTRAYVKQILPTLRWRSTFLSRQRASLTRWWSFSAWLYP